MVPLLGKRNGSPASARRRASLVVGYQWSTRLLYRSSLLFRNEEERSGGQKGDEGGLCKVFSAQGG